MSLWFEADIRYNRDYESLHFVRNITSTCRHSVYLDGVATHEVGHIYGFRDVGQELLTMWGFLARCTERVATLGRGDWLGWSENY